MSNLLQPWICTYLIDVAETYGGNLTSVPLAEKNKKVQAIKFLTPHVPGDDSWVWAAVSDKSHVIPVRFSKQAIQKFDSNPINGGTSLSSFQTALLHIKEFRPLFTRIPGPSGMSDVPQLALDVGMLGVQGCIGEEVYGTPWNVETNENIREWSEGLRTDGGGGNVLKLRKLERQKASPSDSKEDTLKDKPQKNVLPILQNTTSSAKEAPRAYQHGQRSNSGSSIPSGSRLPDRNSKSRNRRAWRNRFHIFQTVPDFDSIESIATCPVPAAAKKKGTNDPQVVESKGVPRTTLARRAAHPRKKPHALDMSTPNSSPSRAAGDEDLPVTPSYSVQHGTPDAHSQAYPDAGRPTTPSQWSPSIVGSQPPSSPAQIEDDADEIQLTPDQPAEDRKFDTSIPRHSRPSHDPGASGNFVEPEPRDELEENASIDTQALPPSSSPPRDSQPNIASTSTDVQMAVVAEVDVTKKRMTDAPPSPTPGQTSMLSDPFELSPQHARRKSNQLRMPFDNLDTSIGKILVPNSDSSQSHSQSQSVVMTSQPKVDDHARNYSPGGPLQSLSYTSASQSHSSQSQTRQSQLRNEVPLPDSNGMADIDTTAPLRKSPLPQFGADEDEPADEALKVPDGDDQEQDMDQTSVESGSSSDAEFELQSVPGEDDDDADDGGDIERIAVEDHLSGSPRGGEEEEYCRLAGEPPSEIHETVESTLAQSLRMLTPRSNSPRPPLSMSKWKELASSAPVDIDSHRRQVSPTESRVPPRLGQAQFKTPLRANDPSTPRQPRVPTAQFPSSKAKGKTPIYNHDTEAWKLPSFMQSHAQAVKKRGLTPDDDNDERPRKKQRRPSLSAGPILHHEAPLRASVPQLAYPDAAERQASSSHTKPVPSYHADQKADSSNVVPNIRHVDFSRSVSVASSSSSPSARAKRNIPNPMVLGKTPVSVLANNTSIRSASKTVKHIDLHALLSPSSSTHSPATGSQDLRGPPRISARNSPAASRPLSETNALPGTSGAKHPTNVSKRGDDTSSPQVNDSVQQKKLPTSRPKLGGLKVNLTMTPDPNGPPLVTWEGLTDILLRTGRARHKEQREKERTYSST